MSRPVRPAAAAVPLPRKRFRKRPYTIEYRGHCFTFSTYHSKEEIKRWRQEQMPKWKRSIDEWANVPMPLGKKLNGMVHAAEVLAWKRDHKRLPYPEHLCGLSDRQYEAFGRWQRRWWKSAEYLRVKRKYDAAIAACQPRRKR